MKTQRNLDRENDFFFCDYTTGVPLPAEGNATDVDSSTIASVRYEPLPCACAERWPRIVKALLEIQNAPDLTPDFLIRQMYTYADLSFIGMDLTNSLSSIDQLIRDNWQGRAQNIVKNLIPKMARLELSLPNAVRRKLPISRLIARGDGKIEDEGWRGMLMVDFADPYIGGLVLTGGCVQEEILFLIYPELIISCLVCEKMEADESILVVGAQRFSNYTGYGGSFKWMTRTIDLLEGKRDLFNRIDSEVIAIDALNLRHFDHLGYDVQFEVDKIDRELGKAFAGFSVITCQSSAQIATGNWGCGVFGGNLELKSMIQLIAASATDRSLNYLAFGEVKFAKKLSNMVMNLQKKNVNIATLYSWLIEYGVKHLKSSEEYKKSLFEYIGKKLNKQSHCLF